MQCFVAVFILVIYKRYERVRLQRHPAKMSNISLASMTGTKVDSAAKHIVVCRVCTDFYSQFANTCQELLEHAQEYMVKRDEICLGIGRPFNPKRGFSHADNKAYIPVFSNSSIFSKNQSNVANYYIKLYDARTEEVSILVFRFFYDAFLCRK